MNQFDKLMTAKWQQISFCCALIERMAPNYALFSDVCDFGDAKVINDGLEVLWTCCAGHDQKVNFEKQLEKVELVTPEVADFDSYGVRPAVDACVALSMLLEVCAGMQELDINAFESLYLSTIESYLDFIQEQDGNADIHPLISDAEAFFAAVNAQLAIEGDLRKDRVKAVKAFVRGLSSTNIGIEVA